LRRFPLRPIARASARLASDLVRPSARDEAVQTLRAWISADADGDADGGADADGDAETRGRSPTKRTRVPGPSAAERVRCSQRAFGNIRGYWGVSTWGLLGSEDLGLLGSEHLGATGE
jgi:hypothetical protein